MSDADRGEIDSAARDALAQSDGATALYVGIWIPEKGFYEQAYGESSPGVAATLADHNRIGSVTKTFTATAVLQLVASGEIALTDTLATLLPELAAEFPALTSVTVDQLLGMRTGIGDFFCCPGSLVDTYFADPTHLFTVHDLVAEGLRMRSPPSVPLASAEYSNTNYVILGEVLRVVTGHSVHEVLTDLARSVGLEQTGLLAPDVSQMPAPAAHGYMGAAQVAEHRDLLPPGVVGGIDVSDWSLSFAGAAGAMYSTLGDLGAWAATGYGSALLPADLASRRLSPPDGRDFDYGYGITVSGDWIGHSGLVEGWITDTAFNPTTGATWVLIVNSGGGEAVLQAMAEFARPQ
ncbi:MAG TPA: serine hydrolase domain-containing protein [Methylomirabilota bacterium]|nr:serine hydrolase domain-containing protein [Methylomirabilota bacterium]